MMSGARDRALAVALVLLMSVAWATAAPTPTPPRDIATLFAELNALDTIGYTGGLPQRNRVLSEEIRWTMRATFPHKECPKPAPGEGTLIGFTDEAANRDDAPAKEIDPNLAQLLKAFDHERQEVRDTAAYAIGLLGPAASDAEPTLRKRFASYGGKGNWHNDAYGKVTCQSIGTADFRKVLPDSLLPPQEPWPDFLRKAAVLMANLYLNPDIEYPPGMMGYAYSNYGIANQASDAVPLLARILDSEELSRQKRIEAAEALSKLEPEIAKPALAALLRRTDTTDQVLRYYVTEALLHAKHDAAIPLLIRRVDDGYDHYQWERELCDFGPKAIAAQDALLAFARRPDMWPAETRGAYRALGCIGAKKAVPVLIASLAFPDWQTQGTIAIALGRIADSGPETATALEGLAARHWSKQVRSAAENALVKLARRPAPPPQPDGAKHVEEIEVVRIHWGGGAPIDHGLPWCDPRGKYSLDGSRWFRVVWTKRKRAPVPKSYPIAVKEFGTRQFMHVDDGWLYGADFGHYGGEFQHVADDGTVSELDEPWHNATQIFTRDGQRILASVWQVLKSGEAGQLFEIARATDGKWKGKRVAALPSAANFFATGPNGEVLLGDGPNTYAVIGNEVVPLKCEKTFPGSFFARDRQAAFRHRTSAARAA